MTNRNDKKKAVLISGFGWFENRLKPLSEVLEEKGYDVSFFLSDFDHISKSYIVDKCPECCYIHVPAYKKNMSLKRILSHKVFGYKIRKMLEREKPNLIYSLLPPNSVAPPCLNYKKKNPECKYYIDLIDLWPGTLQFISNSNKGVDRLASRLFGRQFCNYILNKWGGMRNDSLLVADHVFAECDYYKKILAEYIREATTLYLFKQINDEDEVKKSIANRNLRGKKDRLVLGYLGSINHLIDIERICEVLSALTARNISVEFLIIGGGESTERLIAAANETGVDVVYYGKVFDRNKKLQILGTCDYGFNIMKKDVSVGLTIKSVDYFSMGVPIINSIQGDTWDIVSCENAGVNLENDFVDRMLDMKQNRAANAFYCFRKYFSRDAFKETLKKTII